MALVKQTVPYQPPPFTAVFMLDTWGIKWLIIRSISHALSRQAPDCPSDSQTPPDHCADPELPSEYVRLFAHGHICSCHRLLPKPSDSLKVYARYSVLSLQRPAVTTGCTRPRPPGTGGGYPSRLTIPCRQQVITLSRETHQWDPPYIILTHNHVSPRHHGFPAFLR